MHGDCKSTCDESRSLQSAPKCIVVGGLESMAGLTAKHAGHRGMRRLGRSLRAVTAWPRCCRPESHPPAYCQQLNGAAEHSQAVLRVAALAGQRAVPGAMGGGGCSWGESVSGGCHAIVCGALPTACHR